MGGRAPARCSDHLFREAHDPPALAQGALEPLANSNKISTRLDVVEGRAGSYVRVTNSVPRFPTAAAGEWCGRSWGEARTEGIAPFGSSGPGPAILGHDGSTHAFEHCIAYRCHCAAGLGDLGLGQRNQ